VAANLCAVAVGTETDGSIVAPSSVNGIVGIKPTVGLVSRDGIIPISRSQDTAGPMARTVADAAALLTALAGPDPRDPATHDAPSVDFTSYLDVAALDGARLGVVRPTWPVHPAVVVQFERLLAVLAGRGAVLVEGISLDGVDDIGPAELTVLLYELKHGLGEWFAEFTPGGELASLADVVEWNRRHADAELRWFGQEHFERAATCGALTDETYLDARAACLRIAGDEGVDAALADHRLDALIAPTDGPAWLTDLVNGDSHAGSFSTPAAVGGHPHVTVPMGSVAGLPVGVSLVGPRWGDGPLIGLAYALEQVTTARRAPSFAPSADLGALTIR
jgi:amidase